MKTAKKRILILFLILILAVVDLLGAALLYLHRVNRNSNVASGAVSDTQARQAPEETLLSADSGSPAPTEENVHIWRDEETEPTAAPDDEAGAEEEKPEEKGTEEEAAEEAEKSSEVTEAAAAETVSLSVTGEEAVEYYAYIPGGVDLRWFLPDAEFELLFASENNVTGRSLYPAVPLLEENTAYMLKKAYEQFKADGYILKVYDAYRPRSAQQALWNVVHNNKYIADPNNGGSWHQGGRALDLSLVDAETGIELEMPTPMHTFSDAAGRYADNGWSEEATKNVEYMTQVMRAAGFSTIRTEWWHFEYNLKGPPVLDSEIDIASLEYLTREEMNERMGYTPE